MTDQEYQAALAAQRAGTETAEQKRLREAHELANRVGNGNRDADGRVVPGQPGQTYQPGQPGHATPRELTAEEKRQRGIK